MPTGIFVEASSTGEPILLIQSRLMTQLEEKVSQQTKDEKR
jgi:hypothetical protein